MSDSPELISLVEEIWNPAKSCLLCIEDTSIIIRRTDILYHLARHIDYGWDTNNNWLVTNIQIFGAFHVAHLDYGRYYLGNRSYKESEATDLITLTSCMQQTTELLRTRWADLVYE